MRLLAISAICLFSLQAAAVHADAPPPAAPSNDLRSDAVVAGALPFVHSADTSNATTEDGEDLGCARTGRTAWYRITVPQDAVLEVRTRGSAIDATVAVFRDAARLACNDDADGTAAALRWQAEGGVDYDLQVGGYAASGGPLVVRIADPGPVPAAPAFASDPAIAPIRPGVRISTARGTCTANFVYVGTGVLEGRAYLGTAAHCVQSAVGSPVWLDRDAFGRDHGGVIGTVAYSSFKQLGITSVSCGVGSCSSRPDDPDFALIELHPAQVQRTSPSVIHFGGPTGVATRDSLFEGQRVLSFGNSPLRANVDPVNRSEGYLVELGDSRRDAYAYFLTTRVFGDSGSEVLTADGRALGVLVTISTGDEAGPAASNGITLVQVGLEVGALEGFTAHVATAPLLSSGILPGE